MSGTKAEKEEEIMGHYTSEGHIVHLDNTAPVEGTPESPRKMLPGAEDSKKKGLIHFLWLSATDEQHSSLGT